MATTRKSGDERMISRTYRAAIRIGEDFITLEETIALPLDASDEEVAQAVDLGWRIYRAQRDAAETQIADVRGHASVPAPITVRDPDSPASDKQRNYVVTLQENLAWTSEQLATYAEEQNVDLVTMNKGQASTFIDGLKKLAEERNSYTDPTRTKTAAPKPETVNISATRSNESVAINEKQIHAMERLAQQHNLNLDNEARQRFGVAVHGLSYDQAAALLRELQRPATSRQRVNEPAL